MENETTPIRKTIAGVSINTETAHRFHADFKVVSETIDGKLMHRRISQALFQTPDGHYFLAFWNKPEWNEATLVFDFVSDARLMEAEQAKQWMRTYCPEKFADFVESMDKKNKTASSQSVNLRMPTELRDYLLQNAQLAGHSLNKICLNLINAGLSFSAARQRVDTPPSFDRPLMPSGEPALDEFERALPFVNPDEQALASYLETLYAVFRLDFPNFLPFAVHTLYRLVHIHKNEAHVLCFAKWLAQFHRPGFEEMREVRLRNPSPVGSFGAGRWGTPPAQTEPPSA